jgi:TolA-binding protein
MGAVTYPDATVEAELAERFVPCKVESASAPDLARKMNVRWLPGLVVADADERPANVQVGFLPPADFLLELDFGRAILAMGAKRYDEADALFGRVAATSGDRAPEALFWWGISRYRQSKAFADCQAKWREITERWPSSLWTKKVAYALR